MKESKREITDIAVVADVDCRPQRPCQYRNPQTQCEVEMGFMCPMVPGCIEPPLTSFVSDGRVSAGLQVTLWLSLFYCVTIRAHT